MVDELMERKPGGLMMLACICEGIEHLMAAMPKLTR